MFYSAMVIPTACVYLAAYKTARTFQDVCDLVRWFRNRRAAR